MTLRAWLEAAAKALPGGQDRSGPRCRADWRRPEGYWRCSRSEGHRGRHKMRAGRLDAEDAEAREPGRGGAAAG